MQARPVDGQRGRGRDRDEPSRRGRRLLHHLEGAAAGDDDEARPPGRCPRRIRAPISLSSALWRPTSSRTASERAVEIGPGRGVDRAGLGVAAAGASSMRQQRRAGSPRRDTAGPRRAAARRPAAARPRSRSRRRRSRCGPPWRACARDGRASARAPDRRAGACRPPPLGSTANRADLVGRRDDALGQAEAVGEVLEVGRGRHHHRVGHAAVDEVDRHLDGQRPRAVARLRIVVGDDQGRNAPGGLGRRAPRRDQADRVTRPHSAGSRSASATHPPRRTAPASRRAGWCAGPAPPSPCIRGSWSPSRSSRW